MSWDPARVSAALPSGVGFLGAALIVKDKRKDIDGEIHHFVKGINTAASVWLSAAVGGGCCSHYISILANKDGPRY